MANMQFDLISPERRYASLEVTAVDLPASEGDMTAMPDHAALIATLKPGLVKAHGDSGVEEFLVTGGFVEVTAESAIVLAEQVLPKDEVTREAIETLVNAAEESVPGKEGADLDAAQKYLADTKALLAALN